MKKEKPRELRDWWLVELSLNFTWWWTTLTFLYSLQFSVLEKPREHPMAWRCHAKINAPMLIFQAINSRGQRVFRGQRRHLCASRDPEPQEGCNLAGSPAGAPLYSSSLWSRSSEPSVSIGVSCLGTRG